MCFMCFVLKDVLSTIELHADSIWPQETHLLQCDTVQRDLASISEVPWPGKRSLSQLERDRQRGSCCVVHCSFTGGCLTR